MRRFVCLIILVKLLGVLDVYSQKKESNFQLMADSCYVYLEKQDSVSFINTLSQLYEAYLKENDTYYQISQKLERILLEDQSIRLLYLDARKNKVELVECIRTYMNEIDKRNSLYAFSVLKEHGWLTTDEISERANEALFLIVQHCNDEELQNQCLDMLKEKLTEYPTEKWHYAFLTDRFAMNQGKEQVYGTQKIIRKGIPYIVPLKYPEKVDSLRTEMGLSPLWDELNEEYDSEWDLEKYFQDLPLIKQIYDEYCSKRH